MSTEPLAAPSPLLLPDGRPAASAWTLDPEVRHLNHGSFGAVPRAAQDVQAALRRRMEASPVEWFPAQPQLIADARREIAAYLRSPVDGTALVPNASAGASVVYGSLPHRAGAEILVTDHGYGAVTMGAARLARRWGGTLRTVHVPLDATADEAFRAVTDAFTDRTALAVVDHITSATARLMPVGRIAAEARRRGITLLVDGAHAPGMLADPLAGLEADYWVGNLHKFPCAPRGTAALVARAERRRELHPLIDSWGATEPFPERFDHQGTVDATHYLAAPAALGFVEDTWGWDSVRDYVTRLGDHAQHTVAAAFARLTGEDHTVRVGMPAPALRLVRLPDGLAGTREEADALRDEVARKLRVTAAFTSFGGTGYVRLSAHAYNTPGDYDHFAESCVPVLTDWARERRS
ncbi:aminotransferase class V-fold PLP-dependent enzyme [Streptomyces abyssomicinicus]|uniref:aminotransferase class V-fold PLP-dependent enzyme n=1 Tax=Streptomyces abyssomicinicus TaxID=574929 RepID=UPI00124FDAEA|nr:aminotransferase class V-fold PLP-dependent enzyme [Streptomyces abyssomicinicus]